MSLTPNSPNPCTCTCEPVPITEHAFSPILSTASDFEFGSTPVMGAEELIVLGGLYVLLVALMYPLVAHINRRKDFCLLALNQPPIPWRGRETWRLVLSPAEQRAVARVTRAVRALPYVLSTAPVPVAVTE